MDTQHCGHNEDQVGLVTDAATEHAEPRRAEKPSTRARSFKGRVNQCWPVDFKAMEKLMTV